VIMTAHRMRFLRRAGASAFLYFGWLAVVAWFSFSYCLNHVKGVAKSVCTVGIPSRVAIVGTMVLWLVVFSILWSLPCWFARRWARWMSADQRIAEPTAPPTDGQVTPLGNSGATQEPPSVGALGQCAFKSTGTAPSCYRNASTSALVQQGIVLVLAALNLDGGDLLRICLIAFVAFWIGVGFMRRHRPQAPARLALICIHAGYLPLCIVTFFLVHWFWKLRGLPGLL